MRITTNLKVQSFANIDAKYAAVWNGFGYVGYETAVAKTRQLPIVACFATVDGLEAYIIAERLGKV